MKILSILLKVPWGTVIDKSPDVLAKGREIVGNLKRGTPKEEAVTEMAQLINEQGQLIESLSKQNAQLFDAVKTLGLRQRILWIMAVVSSVLALATLILLIFSTR